ncbi:ferritin-2 heavy chain-like [Ochlerotatus camptorhynchus]|uniref:ferritin-2 heavy chain-like n=1 Tax=Ochlerotatus camptorhynchus TaxID=644619 RepID=UPI0031DEF28A
MSIFRQLKLATSRNRLLSTKLIAPSRETNGKVENLAAPSINTSIHNAINEQINVELAAGYTYLSISYHFSKSTVGLMGLSDLYRVMSKEELDHADSLAHYVLKRNGSVDLGSIRKPPSCSWSNIGTTLNETLRLENCVSESLSTLYRLAEKHNDPVTTDFIATEFLKEQIESIRSINLLVARWTSLEKAPNGVYLLDRELRKKTN